MVLDYLTEHPDQAFGLTALSRALSMSKSTCLSVLKTLTETGYVMQHPTRRDYRLGPALVAAGRAAMSRFYDLSAAHALLDATSADLALPINAVTLTDDQVVVTDIFGRRNPFGGFARVGVGVPFVPPYGAGFVAWADPTLWERWLNRADPSPDADIVAALRSSVEAAHRRGFLVALDVPTANQVRPLLDQLRNDARGVDSDQLRALASARLLEVGYFLDGIDADETYSVNTIQVPVIPSPGRNPMTLMALPFGQQMTGAEVLTAGERLQVAARDVAKIVKGP